MQQAQWASSRRHLAWEADEIREALQRNNEADVDLPYDESQARECHIRQGLELLWRPVVGADRPFFCAAKRPRGPRPCPTWERRTGSAFVASARQAWKAWYKRGSSALSRCQILYHSSARTDALGSNSVSPSRRSSPNRAGVLTVSVSFR